MKNPSTGSPHDSCDRHLPSPITMPLAGDSIKTSVSTGKQWHIVWNSSSNVMCHCCQRHYSETPPPLYKNNNPGVTWKTLKIHYYYKRALHSLPLSPHLSPVTSLGNDQLNDLFFGLYPKYSIQFVYFVKQRRDVFYYFFFSHQIKSHYKYSIVRYTTIWRQCWYTIETKTLFFLIFFFRQYNSQFLNSVVI